ncbi:hypothetical protein PFISCL1PPCAC_12589, partial [Pristionchus fissidentatus]
ARGCCFSDLLIVSRILATIVASGSLFELIIFILKGENGWILSVRATFFTLHLCSAICAFTAIKSERANLMVPVIVFTFITLIKNTAVLTLTSLALYSQDTPFAYYLKWLRVNNEWYHDFAATYDSEEQYIKVYSFGATFSISIILLICLRAIYVHYCAFRILKNRSINRRLISDEIMKTSQISIISKA